MLGAEKILVLMRAGNGISEKTCKLAAYFPLLLEGIGIEDFEQSVIQRFSGVDYFKARLFINELVREIGIEEFLVLVREGNGISEETCKLIARFPLLMKSIRTAIEVAYLEDYIKQVLVGVDFSKAKVFMLWSVKEIGFGKFLALVRSENGISKEECELIARLPILVRGMNTMDTDILKRAIERMLSGVDFSKAKVFSDWSVRGIGLEKFLVLVRAGNGISEEMCRLIAQLPFIVEKMEGNNFEQSIIQKLSGVDFSKAIAFTNEDVRRIGLEEFWDRCK
jgi:hypothetical protein